MALITCSSCRTKNALERSVCLSCGAEVPKQKSPLWAAGILIFCLISFWAVYYYQTVRTEAQQRINSSDAQQYVGKRATVCGQVASAFYAVGSRGQPTFLNLDRPYPDAAFTAVIWGENRSKFSKPPERGYPGKRICVSGTVTTYKSLPEIVVADPSQITEN